MQVNAVLLTLPCLRSSCSQTQLETLAGMGFTDPARNIRALMAAGGNVEGAVEWLFSN